MLTTDFDFDLPPELIAQEAAHRGESRLLVLDGGDLEHRSIVDLPELLAPGDLLVVNDTRVIPARLFARRKGTGGKVEILLVEKTAASRWRALARPARRLRQGTVLELDRNLVAQVANRSDDGKIEFEFSEDIEPHLERLGHVPLPPYIQRPDSAADRERYQTVYAATDGAIAAPTAGLHFTRPLLDAVEAAGVEIANVTLHVGLGTFQPVTVDTVENHRMERERYVVPEATATAIRSTHERGGKVVAVGTTVVRTLESVAQAHDGDVVPGAGDTDIFIYPGFEFRVVDRLLSNFHLPRSTLLMLISAFAGREAVLRAYSAAIENRYRFYSYGDATLLTRSS